MKKISIVVSPKQNEMGQILMSRKMFRDENQQIVHEQNILQCFVHACTNEHGKLVPFFVPKEEHFIFKTSNQLIIDKLDTELTIEFTMVSHLSVTLSKDNVTEMLNMESRNEKDISAFLRTIYPHCHVNYKHLTQIKKYLEKCEVSMDNAYESYYVYSLLNRIGLQVNMEYNETEVISSEIIGPVLITGYDSAKWKTIQWGGKRLKKEPFNGIPLIVDEVWKPAANNN